MINVTKAFLPPIEEFNHYIQRIWDTNWVTNNGPLEELEEKLKNHLGVKHLLFCSNGTIVLQLAIRALELKGEIITTPFSYVATANSIVWEGCTPVFADISGNDLNISPDTIKAKITPATKAILATHVYGNPCEVEKINAIAKEYNLKIIYDAAHSFGVKINNNSILNFGDISTISFHATKIFHTGEGGAIITSNDELAEKLKLIRSFGHKQDDYFMLGINGKNSELHAAMGLSVLPHMSEIIEKRKKLWKLYKDLLENFPVQFIEIKKEVNYNYAYFPIILDSEEIVLQIMESLKKINVIPRRYFYPSLNTLPYLAPNHCQISEDISKRVLCLPLYFELKEEEVKDIIQTIKTSLAKYIPAQ